VSSRKLLILTGVVVALFAFIFFIERKMPTTGERQQKGELHWDLPEDRVERIRLERGGDSLELAKTGDAWALVRPEAYPADASLAGELASGLADLKNPGGEPEADGKPEDYGLVKPAVTATFFWTDPASPAKKLSRTIAFGIDIPGTDVTAARVAGAPGVLFVPATLAASVRKPADDWKSKDVFGASPPDVVRLEVARGRGTLTLAKKDGVWWLEQPTLDLADRDAVDRLAGDLSSLRVTEFLPRSQATDLASLGLSPPAFRVTITDTKGGRHVLDLGSTARTETRPTRRGRARCSPSETRFSRSCRRRPWASATGGSCGSSEARSAASTRGSARRAVRSSGGRPVGASRAGRFSPRRPTTS
jgi:hypothetical protein